MESRFVPSDHEKKIYTFWEKKGYLKSPTDGKPFTILMPPPNANGSLHAGHGMYTVDDILIRWRRLQGFASEWIPGMDHAGFETQTTYEKHLRKEGKSRFDFDRKTLYENIFGFVKENSGLIYSQFKRLGFLANWEKSVFTLDPHVIEYVYETFKQMVLDGHVYRDEYIVNYCTFDGTSLADLEVSHVERTDPLYYIKYGPFVLATVRPETKFGDTALAVNPKDSRYTQWIGKEVEVEGLLGMVKLKVIADDFVDPAFGTGVVKVTPGHDPNDFAAGRRHNLEIKQIIDLTGRLTKLAGPYAGMKVMEARKAVVEALQEKGLIEKIDTEYVHSVTTCYRCGRDIEPLTVPNWFIRVEKLKSAVRDVVEKDEVQFHPSKFKERMLQWLDIMHDWPISRQIVWGIRIPVWYKVESGAKNNIHVSWLDDQNKYQSGQLDDFLAKGFSLNEIEKGIQKVIAQPDVAYQVGEERPGDNYLPETDTFDTWFSSGQWPLVTLQGDDMKNRFPTDVMGTQSEILKFWVSRMIMFSLYRTKQVPFKHVYLWSLVVDGKGQKMSKSKGNVVNPIELVDQFGADAFRSALFFGISQDSRIPLSIDKVKAMRNFTNKVWNIGRFILTNQAQNSKLKDQSSSTTSKLLEELETEVERLQKETIQYMDSYKFSLAFDGLYEWLWHRFADYYIEELKDEVRSGNIEVWEKLSKAYLLVLVLLHPFIPFVTEAIWKEFHGESSSILDQTLLQS